MKSTNLILCTLGVLALTLPVSVHAKDKGDKKEMKSIMSQYDTNGNGMIDGDEVHAVKKAFAADPNGPLKRFDTNGDGKLDDTEIAAIKAGKSKKGK